MACLLAIAAATWHYEPEDDRIDIAFLDEDELLNNPSENMINWGGPRLASRHGHGRFARSVHKQEEEGHYQKKDSWGHVEHRGDEESHKPWRGSWGSRPYPINWGEQHKKMMNHERPIMGHQQEGPSKHHHESRQWRGKHD